MDEERRREQLNPLFDDRIETNLLIPCLVLFFIVGIMSIAANSLLLQLLRKTKRLDQASYVFIACLCISDICIGVNQILCVSLRILMEHIDRLVTHWLALTSFFFSYLFEPLSLCLLILIAIDRHLHMKHLTNYFTVMTKKRAQIASVVCLGVNICFTVAIVLAMLNGVYDILSLILAVVFLLMITVVVILYLKTYRSIKTKVRVLFNNTETQRRKPTQNENKKLFQGIIYIIISLLLCYAPYVSLIIVRSILHLMGKTSNGTTYALALAYVFKCLSASNNALILILLNKGYKRHIWQIFKKDTEDSRGKN